MRHSGVIRAVLVALEALTAVTATTGGIAPDAFVFPIQVFQRHCVGTTCSITAYDGDILSALDYVYSLRASFSIASNRRRSARSSRNSKKGSPSTRSGS